LPGGLASFMEKDDLSVISRPNDFLGLNYYTTIEVAAGTEESEDQHVETGPNAPDDYTEMGWLIDPDGFERYLGHIDGQYSPASILITENGASYSDGPDETGRINDVRRIDYVKRHIAAVDRARQSGIPVDGYFVWSLLDNIEWVQGFSQRFGLVWVNQQTGERLPKESFDWYRRVVANGPKI